jgi:MoaA/NifB/PqqE/SkfB family radical SAM enzyme
MSLDMLESILKQISEGKGDFVDSNINLIYTAHYNEVLLYKDLQGMFDLYRKYGFKINVLSNGAAVTKDKVDILNRNIDVINELLFNIPSADKDTWAKYVNINKAIFDKMVTGVRYAIETLDSLRDSGMIRIMVNGLNDRSLTSNGGWVDILLDAPKIDLDVNSGSLAKEVLDLSNMFPGAVVFPNHHLYDRAGHLEDLNIISQKQAIDKYLNKKDLKVVGCSGGIIVRDRTKEWIHINSNGDLFMCCDDFSFETIYDNIRENSIKDIWSSYNRELMVQKARETICTRCSAAIWG